jgi:peptide/nickel transport system substrate-binding protein
MPNHDVRTLTTLLSDGHLSRRSLVKRMVALGLTAPAASALVAATGGRALAAAAQGASTTGSSVNLAFGASDPTTLNPLFTKSGFEQGVTALHFGSLVLMDETMTPTPALAEKWDVADDATSVTFHLRQNANWSDGKPFTADDVIFTFERALDPKTVSTRANFLKLIDGAQAYMDGKAETVTGLSAPDPKTLQVKLSKPDSVFVFQLTAFQGFGILPKHIYESIGPGELESHQLSRTPSVGAGPFLLSKWEVSQYLEFKRNDSYAVGKPVLDSIVLKTLQPSVAIAQLDTQEVDLTTVPVAEIERVKRNTNVQVISQNSLSITSLMVDTSKPYLSLPIRTAFMYAINRQGIVDAIYQGMAEVVNTAVIGPDWMGQIELEPYAYDPDKAKAMLKDAGWDPKQTIELMYSTGQVTEEPALTIIQDNLRAVGVNLELRSYEITEVRERYDSGYDLSLLMGGIYRAEPSTAVTYYIPNPDGTPNNLRWDNKRFDELVAEGTQTVDQDKRRVIYTEAAQILNKELPNLYMWSPKVIFAVNQRLKGFKEPNYQTNVLWNTQEWSVGS